MRGHVLFLAGLTGLVLTGCAHSAVNANSLKPISGKFHYVDGYEPLSGDNTAQVVIEIPTGTTQKWEVDKSDGKLHWEIKDGKPRIVRFLGYPGNYGMVPRTLLAYENGGDGDPLDVLVLGPPVKRGSLVNSKIIGVLKLLDGGEQDDKLIAVMDGSAFSDVNSVEELKQRFPGTLAIIETWFESYKGPGKLKSSGFSSADEAMTILTKAIETYDLQRNQEN